MHRRRLKPYHLFASLSPSIHGVPSRTPFFVLHSSKLLLFVIFSVEERTSPMTRSVRDSSPLDLSAYPALNVEGLERRANYRVIAFREDIVQVLEKREAAAIVFQILFRWQDHLRDKVVEEIEQRRNRGLPPLSPAEVEERLWVYMSYARFVRESGGAVSYNTVIRTLDYLIDKKVVEQRTNQNPLTSDYADYEYRINRQVVRDLLKELPAFPEHSSKKGRPVWAGNILKADTSPGISSSTQMGTSTTPSPHMDTPSPQMGTPSSLLGTEDYLSGDTIQRMLQDSVQELPQQQANDCADDAQAAAVISSPGSLSAEERTLTLEHRRQTAVQGTPEPESEIPTTPLVENVAQPSPGEPSAPPEVILSAEALVALIERKRGTPYDAQTRQRQLVAARTLLGLKLPLDLALVERLYDACYDDWWKAHYGDLHLTHLVEREKHGQIRIMRLLARLQTGERKAVGQTPIPLASARAGGGPAIGTSGRPIFQGSGQSLKVLPPVRSSRRPFVAALEV
jgi:hypothetical protein